MARAERPPLLSIRGLHKRFATPVLVDIDLDLYAGEVHALLGANGAGKTTLARIVCGLTTANSGTLALDGKVYAPAHKGDAERCGVQMVMQELNLIATLSVAENLFLNRLPARLGFVHKSLLLEQAKRALAQVGLDDIDPALPVSQLGVGKQQLVEIAAALARPCQVLVLDEPTAALTDPQIDLLFQHIRQLKAAGVGIVYISHRLEEIRRVADRATVLRDGRVVATRSVDSLPMNEVVRLMVGREVEAETRYRPRDIGDVALRVEHLSCGSKVRDVSFEVRCREIVGVAGLVGSGRTELLRAVYGADRADDGWVFVGDSPLAHRFRHPREAVRAGLALIPEDRKQHGLLLPCSVCINTTLGKLTQVTQPPGWIDARREQAATREFAAVMQMQYRSVEQPVRELSGGNQQKVLISRWLMRDADVLLFDEPTRGIDVAAKAAVYHLLSDLAEQGKAILIVSSDLRELMAMCDRILVMSAGQLAATLQRGDWSQDRIMQAAISGYL